MDIQEYFHGKKILITGGCGFIGSHIIDRLINLDVSQLIVVDDLSSGTSGKYLEDYENVSLLNYDIRDDKLYSILDRNFDMIIHLAAQPNVPVSVEYPYFDFDVNVVGSLKLLEFARKNNIHDFVFAASGGTVYGEAEQLPTPEFYPLRPISNYGAAKAAVEQYLQSYSELYNIKSTSMRFGNVFGPRSDHGVLFDFFHKLKKDPTKLEILGNGTQEKSYLYIDDCINGFLVASSRDSDSFLPVNMASKPTVTVKEIADLISDVMHLNPEYEFTGGDRGWKGDVRKGELDTTLLQSLGWESKIEIRAGVEKYIAWLESDYAK